MVGEYLDSVRIITRASEPSDIRILCLGIATTTVPLREFLHCCNAKTRHHRDLRRPRSRTHRRRNDEIIFGGPTRPRAAESVKGPSFSPFRKVTPAQGCKDLTQVAKTRDLVIQVR